ncbi:MAG TPA: DUF308 domain-containing protein, partial [Methylomirabilota bacterium]|nr:DUF308 domain-containing protein [Methylomirabilota bacterium]
MASASSISSEVQGALVLRGIVTLIFGVAAVFWPGITLLTLIYIFSAFILASGIIGLISGILSVGKGDWWFLQIILGIVELGIGVYLIRHVGVSFATLVLLIGFSLIIRGIVGVVGALFEKATTATGRVLSVIAGLLALVVGIVILFQPVASGVAFVWILGIYALIVGPLEIA